MKLTNYIFVWWTWANILHCPRVYSQGSTTTIDPPLGTSSASSVSTIDPPVTATTSAEILTTFESTLPTTTTTPVPNLNPPKFTILSQRIFDPNQPYSVVIYTEPQEGEVAPTKFQMTISTDPIDGNFSISSNTIELDNGKTATLKIEFPAILPTVPYFNLSITASAPKASNYFYTEWNYIVVDKRTSPKAQLLLETDKPIYKSEDVVRFRVIMLNSDLTPANDATTVSLKIFDPSNTLIKKWEEETFEKGLVSSSLPMGSEPSLGEWTLQASVDGMAEVSTTFTVDNYILPPFKVNVRFSQQMLTFKDDKVVAEIQAKYTYGGTVRGTCNVNVFKCYESSCPWPWLYLTKKVTLGSNGTATFEASMETLYNQWERNYQGYQQSLKIEAICQDSVLSRSQNSSSIKTVYSEPFIIEMLKGSPPQAKPGFPITLRFKIASPDGRPIVSKKTEVVNILLPNVNCIAFSMETTLNLTLPPSGVVNFTLNIPNDVNSGLNVNVTFKGVSRLFYVQWADYYYYPQIALTRIFKNSTTEHWFNVKANKNFKFQTLNYILTAQGRIVKSGSFQSANQTSDYNFQLSPPSGIGPNATLSVFIYNPNEYYGFLSDSLDISMTSTQRTNELFIGFNKATVKPQEDVEISLGTNPGSLVALKGIDQSVLLLKADKDIRTSVNNEGNIFNNQLASIQYSNQFLESIGLVYFTSHGFYRNNYRYWRPYVNNLRMAAGAADELVSSEEINQRKDFPETWLWEEISAEDEITKITRTVPDSMTSWIITGYSLNSESGIAFSDSTSLTVFMPFFITLNTPYSVVQGEAFFLQILVHNYLIGPNVTITLENSNAQFAFLEPKLKNQAKGMKKIKVASGSVQLVTFLIKATKFGRINLEVSATNGQAGDSILQTLLVKPEGILQRKSVGAIIDLRKVASLSQDFIADFPTNRVAGTDKLKITVTGELLGSTIKNLQNLIQMPGGCGEQNMISFVPDIVVLLYKNATGTLTAALKTTLVSYIQIGYQNQLRYRGQDDKRSFSVFDSYNGSTWLTAYVIRSFKAASLFITVDPNVISGGLEFLASKQEANGNFIESGTVIHTEMLGGVRDNQLALSAYVLLTFLEGRNSNTNISNSTQRGLDYIAKPSFAANSTDSFTINLIAYTLHLANHSAKALFLNATNRLAKKLNNGMTYWDQYPNQPPTDSYASTTSIESSSYALLTYLLADRLEDAISVGKWLIRQRNGQGGYFATQDTVVGLTALAKLAEYITNSAGNGNGNGPPAMDISVRYKGGLEMFEVYRDNSRVLQEAELKPPASNTNSTKVTVKAMGEGMALVQLSWSYYVKTLPIPPAFSIDINVNKTSFQDIYNLRICTAFLQGNFSHMALMEITLPSGFVFDSAKISSANLTNVSRYDLSYGNNGLNLYYAALTPIPVCVNLPIIRSFEIVSNAPAFVQVYDYYDMSRKALEYYDVPKISVCDICGKETDCTGLNLNCTAKVDDKFKIDAAAVGTTQGPNPSGAMAIPAGI